MTTEPVLSPDWHALERRTFDLIGCRAYPLLQYRKFGITLLKLQADADESGNAEPEPPLYNAPGNQWRFKLPLIGIVSEFVFDTSHERGVREHHLSMFTKTQPDQFRSALKASRPMWMLVVRGRYQEDAGKLSGYQGHLESGQAHFTPMLEKPDELVQPPRHVQ